MIFFFWRLYWLINFEGEGGGPEGEGESSGRLCAWAQSPMRGSISWSQNQNLSWNWRSDAQPTEAPHQAPQTMFDLKIPVLPPPTCISIFQNSNRIYRLEFLCGLSETRHVCSCGFSKYTPEALLWAKGKTGRISQREMGKEHGQGFTDRMVTMCKGTQHGLPPGALECVSVRGNSFSLYRKEIWPPAFRIRSCL